MQSRISRISRNTLYLYLCEGDVRALMLNICYVSADGSVRMLLELCNSVADFRNLALLAR